MLTERQRRFVREYIADFNATRAAMRAGYSAHSARHYGATLTKLPQVRAAIERAAGQQEYRILLDADRVIVELMRIAFSDIRTYVAAKDGTLALKPLSELSPAEGAAIAQILPGTAARGPVLRLHAKKQALKALARHVGLNERRASVDPRMLVAETARIRNKLLRAAGLDPADLVLPEEE